MELDLIAHKDRRIAKALANVLQNLSTRPSRTEVARVACLEPTYFSKRFRRVVGQSYASWNRAIRVDKACGILRTTDRSVQQVGRDVGYADTTTFERVFRKLTGMCPSAYRRRTKRE
jgi:transcriptional regulator GlxA family with amidase domain